MAGCGRDGTQHRPDSTSRYELGRVAYPAVRGVGAERTHGSGNVSRPRQHWHTREGPQMGGADEESGGFQCRDERVCPCLWRSRQRVAMVP